MLQQGAILASLVVEGDGWTIRYLNVTTTNNTAFGLLAEAGERLDFQVAWMAFVVPDGKLVTSINGTANGAHGMFWQYWVDGLYGDRAADKKEIFYGGLVLWKFDMPREGG